ncbi:MAG TPA: class I SAM-dependent methyltransferase [Dehalococcoidia bacterium]|nr:class I SAM-dependent methyltransferase [Dehalococcoidia bacterium]
MTTQTIDEGKAAAFGGQMVGILNGAALAFMVSIGHHTGLFDTLAALPAGTSQRIAEAAGLNERYVREWLGAMVTGRIVEYDPAAGSYRLPPEHALALTRAAGPNNLAVMASMLPQLAQVEDGIIASFRNGGGVPYADFPRFQRFMAELSGMIFDASLLGGTLKLVPGLTERLEAGIDVADIACGSGHAINLMAQAFPNSRFTGYDFSAEGIAAGHAEAQRLGLTNVEFVEQDVATLAAANAYDLITVFDAIHDQAQPRTVLRNLARALRPGGTLLAVDIRASSKLEENLEHPLAPALYTISTMHCMTVSLALAGEGLGTMWGEQTARDLFAQAGLVVLDVKQVEGDILNNYYICGKA